MPRKGPAPKRQLIPDPVYHSELVTRFINRMLLQGKRSTAERIFYGAMEVVEQRAGAPALEVFERAMRNVMPVVKCGPGAWAVLRIRYPWKFARIGASRWEFAGW